MNQPDNAIATEEDIGWGVSAARFNLRIARLAADKLASGPERHEREEWYLHYGAFFTFLYASIQALYQYDGKRDPALGEIQQQYFEAEIRTSSRFKMIQDELAKVVHSLADGAMHPEWPIEVVMRHGELKALSNGFPPTWPDGEFRGEPVLRVVDSLWRTVSNWIDAIDAKDANRRQRDQ